MSHRRFVIKKCPKCRRLYRLGWNGIRGQCDKCAGVKRDREGYAWMPGQREMKLQDFFGGGYFITREAAGVQP